MSSELYIGLMTGTSVDGIDAVLVRIDDDSVTLLGSHSEPIPDPVRADILALCQPGNGEIDLCGSVSQTLGCLYANACHALLLTCGIAASAIRAIGCHGQTVRHRPGTQGFSLQLVCADTLAVKTGIPVVHNFRNKDMVLGGQGAPLVPPFHRQQFGRSGERLAVINIGGMANASLLEGRTLLGGFDTGPGNVLMDDWIARQGLGPFDRNGDWAASGRVDPGLLSTLLSDPYFSLPPPKSTGREHFNAQWLTSRLPAQTRPADIQATLAELTARSIADALAAFRPDALLICGGGAHNDYLLQRLHALTDVAVNTTEKAGLHPDWVEAAAFAWLAWARWNEKPGNAPVVTGASREAILGQVTLP